MLRTALCTFAAALLPSVATSQNPPIRIVTLDASRIGTCGALTSGFTGPLYESIRGDLLAPANFGPAGVVPRSVQLTEVLALDFAALSNADIVLLPRISSGMDEGERMLLNSFVLAGGGVLWFANGAARVLEDFLDVTPGPFGLGVQASVSNPSSPIVSGPFGSLAQGTTVPHQFAGSFADVGPHGTAALTTTGGTFGASFALGAGRVVAFTDEEIVISTPVSGCAAAAYGTNARVIFLNSVAHLAPDAGINFTNQDVVLSAYGSNCPGGANAVPRLTIHGEPFAGGEIRLAITDGEPGAVSTLLLGASRASAPFAGCTVLVGALLPVGGSFPLQDNSGPRPGSIAIPLRVPSGVAGAMSAQAVSLDMSAASGLTWSRGAEGVF